MTSIHVPERSWRNTLRSANNPDHYDSASLPPSYQLPGDDSTLLDISQRIEQKVAQYNTSENVLKRWLFEILSWTTSAICIVSQLTCLHCADPKLILHRVLSSEYAYTLGTSHLGCGRRLSRSSTC
jgi:hypothetical protein